MCYAKPGPRCSGHTRAELKSAEINYAKNPTTEHSEALTAARLAHAKSPEGIRDLRSRATEAFARGDIEDGVQFTRTADEHQQERESQMEAYKQTHQGHPYGESSDLDPNLPGEELIEIGRTSSSSDVLFSVAQHANTPREFLTELADRMAEDVELLHAMSPTTPQEDIAGIAIRSNDWRTHEFIVENPSTSNTTLRTIARIARTSYTYDDPYGESEAMIALISERIGTFNADGFDIAGYDIEGYNAEGYDSNGYDKRGYDRDGYDRSGYDEDGLDDDGYNMFGSKPGWSGLIIDDDDY